MRDINTALAASKQAVEQLIAGGEHYGVAWSVPRVPGKWSPSQIVEHVARSLEESANMAVGRPSKFPRLPGVVRPIVRGLLFKRVLRMGAFPKAKTNKAMNPVSGPATAAEGRARLETAHQKFDEACRQSSLPLERADEIVLRPLLPLMTTHAGCPSVRNGVADGTIWRKLGPQPSIAGERIAGILVNDRVQGGRRIRPWPDLFENDGSVRELRGRRETAALESAQGARVHADTNEGAMGLRTVEATLRELLHIGEERVPGKRVRLCNQLKECSTVPSTIGGQRSGRRSIALVARHHHQQDREQAESPIRVASRTEGHSAHDLKQTI